MSRWQLVIKSPFTYQQISRIIVFGFGAVDHEPMIADQHPLLEEGGIGTGVRELPPQGVAHVVQFASRVDISVIPRGTSLAGETRLHVGIPDSFCSALSLLLLLVNETIVLKGANQSEEINCYALLSECHELLGYGLEDDKSQLFI